MCIQRKTEKTNRLKRMRYLYYMYIHVQIVAESKVLWLFQFCRKKKPKLWETFVLKHGLHRHIT